MLAVIQEAAAGGLNAVPLAVWVVAGTLVATALLKRKGVKLPMIGDNPKWMAWAAGLALHFAFRALGLGDGDIVFAADAVEGAMEALTAQVLYKHGAKDVLAALSIEGSGK